MSDSNGLQASATNAFLRLDLTGPFKRGKIFLVGVDSLSRFAHALPVSSAFGMAVISFLIVQKKSREDTNGVFSEQGPAFISTRF